MVEKMKQIKTKFKIGIYLMVLVIIFGFLAYMKYEMNNSKKAKLQDELVGKTFVMDEIQPSKQGIKNKGLHIYRKYTIVSDIKFDYTEKSWTDLDDGTKSPAANNGNYDGLKYTISVGFWDGNPTIRFDFHKLYDEINRNYDVFIYDEYSIVTNSSGKILFLEDEDGKRIFIIN